AGADRAQLAPLVSGADILLGATFRGCMDRAFLTLAPNLRLIAKYTIGVDDVDVDAASALGVLVTHCPTEANWGGVAEGAMAMMLAVLKRVRERDRHVKAGGWREPPIYGTYVGKRGDGYAGITIGIVGLGRAGSRVADLLRPWGARVLAADPYVDPSEFVRHGVERTDLDTLLRDSDVVTLHCNLTTETRGLLDRRRLKLMKPTAVLVNTARGAVVDLDALCDALERHALGAAALDVLPDEPASRDARILKLGDRVLLSPHMIAANQGGTLGAAIPWAAEAVLAALRGGVPQRVYNTEAVAKWQARFGGKPLLPA
ncbi:MAG TPA: NAD(P)-dependent oxidoreductase, partial [Gammaproteobacteria bacterium]|nr:NAD(P)-dependent oxidoreductase [Gammaproteobacteria bacterium]